MFLTFEGLEGRVPSQALVDGFQFWDATVLRSPTPWYLLTVQRDGARGRRETVFIASESMLVGILNDLKGDAVLGLARFDTCDRLSGEWQMARVSEVWCDATLPEGSRLFFRLRSEETLRDASLQAIADSRRGWLLARIADPAAH